MGSLNKCYCSSSSVAVKKFSISFFPYALSLSLARSFARADAVFRGIAFVSLAADYYENDEEHEDCFHGKKRTTTRMTMMVDLYYSLAHKISNSLQDCRNKTRSFWFTLRETTENSAMNIARFAR